MRDTNADHIPELEPISYLSDDSAEFRFTQPMAKAPKSPEPVLVIPAARAAYGKLMWLAAALSVLLLTWYVGPRIVEEYQYRATLAEQRAQYEAAREVLDQQSPLKALSVYYELVTQRVGPSVVHINTRIADDDVPADAAALFDPYERFHRESRGQGSGVIVSEDGYIVTNYHVVRGSSRIEVALRDRRTVSARLIGFDEETDVAVLRITADNLIAADWADSDKLRVGSLVWAIGSPFGLQQSVTAGILSAKHRDTEGNAYQDFLQTDAAVNPGNSGGPLVDEQGRIVGINTAIVGQTYQGISFAIPSNVVRNIYEQIKVDGHVSRGWLGVRMEDVTAELAAQVGLKQATGVHVVAVPDFPDLPSPARLAGVQPGDIVLRWNDQDIDDRLSLTRQVAQTKVGTSANLVVLRDGTEISLTVAVARRPTEMR